MGYFIHRSVKYLNINYINLEWLNFKTNNISYQPKWSVVTLRSYVYQHAEII